MNLKKALLASLILLNNLSIVADESSLISCPDGQCKTETQEINTVSSSDDLYCVDFLTRSDSSPFVATLVAQSILAVPDRRGRNDYKTVVVKQEQKTIADKEEALELVLPKTTKADRVYLSLKDERNVEFYRLYLKPNECKKFAVDITPLTLKNRLVETIEFWSRHDIDKNGVSFDDLQRLVNTYYHPAITIQEI